MTRRTVILALSVLTMLASALTLEARQNCAGTSVGFKPLTELGTDLYKGYPGGLYPDGLNVRPATHDSIGRAHAAEIKPLNASGVVDTETGKIVLLSIGMSNATQEFSLFKAMADTDRVKNTQLVIVDGAQGGQTASAISDPNANFWTVIEQRLASAGATAQQVQAVWVKEANAGPTQAFPVHAQILQGNYESIACILKSKYPNIKVAYYSSRIYAGYATTTLNPEPYAYESGFAVKWLIEKQINSDTTLTPVGPNPKAPWLAWGPSLWADGLIPRSDGLTWECSDFAPDGTHPGTNGRFKVATMLLAFFKSEPTATGWFLQPNITGVETDRQLAPKEFALQQNYPNPFNPSTTIEFTLPEDGRVKLRVYNMLGEEVATLLNEERKAGIYHQVVLDGSRLASGVYFSRVEFKEKQLVKKMLLLK